MTTAVVELGPRDTAFDHGVFTFTWPSIIRQYTGFVSAEATGARFRENLAKGQTGLSTALCLSTQVWRGIDDPMAAGQVGEVGVPISHIGDMGTLFQGIPQGQVNSSFTINASANWLAALYIAHAEQQGVSPEALKWTTQSDLWKEFTARGAWEFDPDTSRRFQVDLFRYVIANCPRANPMNASNYHLCEVGATSPMGVAYMFAAAFRVLDELKALCDAGEISQDELNRAAGRMSFFVSVSPLWEAQSCTFRAAHIIWDEKLRERYGVEDAKYRVLRMGGQSESVGLTEQQPEINLMRLANTMYGARYGGLIALQLSCADEAYRTPDALMQQLALRTQQVFLYETDARWLARDADGNFREPHKRGELFVGSADDKLCGAPHFEGLTTRAKQVIEWELGMVASFETDEDRLRYIKRRLLEANRERLEGVEKGGIDEKGLPYGIPRIGVNSYTETAGELLTGLAEKPQNDPEAEATLVRDLHEWCKARDASAVEHALRGFDDALKSGDNTVPALIECAKAGCTTGETGNVVRQRFGEYRPPNALEVLGDAALETSADVSTARELTEQFEADHGHRPRGVIAATGLDGHSSGGEQVAMRAKAVGFEITYLGIRVPPERIAQSAKQNGAHFVGISILSGAVVALVDKVREAMEEADCGDTAMVVGGIISEPEQRELLSRPNVVGVFTPKDFDLTSICTTLLGQVEEHMQKAA